MHKEFSNSDMKLTSQLSLLLFIWILCSLYSYLCNRRVKVDICKSFDGIWYSFKRFLRAVFKVDPIECKCVGKCLPYFIINFYKLSFYKISV